MYGKRFKYVRNCLDLMETAGNDFDLWEMIKMWVKWVKYVENMWETAKVCEIWLRYDLNGLGMWEMT